MPIHNLAEAELATVRGKKIGFVFQSYQLIATLTALENVLLPHELNVAGSGLDQARRLLGEVGLEGAHGPLSRAAIRRRTAASGAGEGVCCRTARS